MLECKGSVKEKWTKKDVGQQRNSLVIGSDGTIYTSSYTFNNDYLIAIESLHMTPTSSLTQTISPTLTSTPTPTHSPVQEHDIDIYANKTTFTSGNTVELTIWLYNPSSITVDMYAACFVWESNYWYPVWDTTPHSTEIEIGTWDKKILQIPSSLIRPGSYTFYAAITEHDTYNIIKLDSVTITIE